MNGGYPALAQYVPGKEASILVPWGIHVIEVKDNRIFHVQNFINAKFIFPIRASGTNRPMNSEIGIRLYE